MRTRAPRFRVRALGSFTQQPGCPEHVVQALGPSRVEQVCLSECYHPGDERRPITRVEVVRIRPQQFPGEPLEGLVEDPWRVFPCEGDGAGCAVEFEDEEFAGAGRDAVYYARAIENPTCRWSTWDAIRAGVAPRPDLARTLQERAWSSPIWIVPR